ncbi:hydrogenase expression/formation protein [Zavarzinia sp.]|uniref:hydrogenase expression/formation protein n=1 Tax=Zavarzinia sp. TaxID=2027920 RepID=UPI003565FB0E
MSTLFGMTRPPVGYGPGSQPSEAGEDDLEFLPMPTDMKVYAPHLPEVEDPTRVAAGLQLLDRLCIGLDGWRADAPFTLSLDRLNEADRALIDEALGEGEVSAVVALEGERIEIQEATLAGVWRLRRHLSGGKREESVEVGAFPRAAVERAFPASDLDIAARAAVPPAGVMNAAPVLFELQERARGYRPGDAPHVVNLSLLPLSPEDGAFLAEVLGQGATTILSRGYGNCRITSTNLPHVWWVRFYNSTDMLILDTLEVTDVPQVACAAAEDIADSAVRLADILTAIR